VSKCTHGLIEEYCYSCTQLKKEKELLNETLTPNKPSEIIQTTTEQHNDKGNS